MKMNLADKKKIVLKVGTESITTDAGLDYFMIDKIVDDVFFLKNEGKKITIISSGAIASGRRKVGKIEEIGKEKISRKQAYAAIGQPHLMNAYIKSFGRYNINVAQCLVTYNDFDSRRRLENLRAGYEELLEMDCIPIFNENDVTATEEITFGDNDILAAYVTVELHNDLLLILTTKDGLYRGGKVLEKVIVYDAEQDSLKKEYYDKLDISREGRGGIESKLEAAKITAAAGKPCIISNRIYSLKNILEGKAPRTLFLPKE